MIKFEHLTVFSDIEPIVSRYGIDRRGVMHLGAWRGGEFPLYFDAGFTFLASWEPQSEFYAALIETVRAPAGCTFLAYNYALADMDGTAPMYVPAHTAAASLLRLLPHPYNGGIPIDYDTELTVKVTRFDCLENAELIASSCNLLVLDTEGTEIDVARGMGRFFSPEYFDMVVIECSKDARAVTGALSLSDVVEFMNSKGFIQASEPPTADYAPMAALDIIFVKRELGELS